MRKWMLRVSGVIGLLLWLWVGSYVYLREFRVHPLSGYFPRPHSRSVIIPDWVRPVIPVYRPLIAADSRLTGEQVRFTGRRIHIGSTANF